MNRDSAASPSHVGQAGPVPPDLRSVPVELTTVQMGPGAQPQAPLSPPLAPTSVQPSTPSGDAGDPRRRAAAAAAEYRSASASAQPHLTPLPTSTAASTATSDGHDSPDGHGGQEGLAQRWRRAPVSNQPVSQNAGTARPSTHARTTAPAGRANAATGGQAGASTPSQPTRPGPSTTRASFLRRTDYEAPAQQGWRGKLTGLGFKVSPGPSERAERADLAAVARHWVGHRTVAVVNSKGGASKSPTTALLSACFARHGGTGVLAWENNQTRGTLGWRTEQGPHENTLMDLLPVVPHLLDRHASVGDLASYVHHQVADRYDVLRAQPFALADEQRIRPEDVSAIHEVAAKFNRLIFMDSGNDESDPMWRQMIDLADQIVVPTTTRDDHAEVAALLLEALARGDEHRQMLAERAVVVVSQADPSAHAGDLQRVADGFADLAREVVTIPYDSSMVDGLLRWDALHRRTQRHWLRAGAAVSRGL